MIDNWLEKALVLAHMIYFPSSWGVLLFLCLIENCIPNISQEPSKKILLVVVVLVVGCGFGALLWILFGFGLGFGPYLQVNPYLSPVKGLGNKIVLKIFQFFVAGACIQSQPQSAPSLHPLRVLTLPSHWAWPHPPTTDLPSQPWAGTFLRPGLHVPHRICYPQLWAVKQSSPVLTSQLGPATGSTSRKLGGIEIRK